MNKVELHPAYSWICDECGRQNFCSAVKWEGPPEEKERLLKLAGILAPEQSLEDMEGLDEEYKTSIDLEAVPMEVTCVHCNVQFEVEPPDSALDPDFNPWNPDESGEG